MATAPIRCWEEDVPTAGLILGVAPPIAAATTVETPSGAGMPVSRPAPPANTGGTIL
jgi:hypothetical protein